MRVIQYSTLHKKRVKTMKLDYTVYLAGFIAFAFCGYILIQELQASRVYAVCIAAHHEVSGESEEACGNMQDKYHYEFLCSRIGNCWVEKI